MVELLRRLLFKPALAARFVLASVLANLLGLTSAVYVTQVLNRYVAHGVDATLLTLTAGAAIAVAAEYGFRRARLKLAAGIGGEPDERLSLGAFGVLTTIKLGELDRLPSDQRVEVLRGLERVEQTYSAPNLTAIVDMPFALVFLFVLCLMSLPIALVVALFMAGIVALGLYGQRQMKEPARLLAREAAVATGLISTVNSAPETARAFGGESILIKEWLSTLRVQQNLRRLIAFRQGNMQAISQGAMAVMSIVVVAVGAISVVRGDLDVGLLIGANILAARALSPLLRFAQLGEALVKADEALARLRGLARLEAEPEGGATLGRHAGSLEFREVGFERPGAAVVLFEGVSLRLEPGSVLAVIGRNGAGKTSFLRLALGLLEPTRGTILADGVDVRQLQQRWWRRQVAYLPQEPTFMNVSFADNLRAANPALDAAALERLVERAGMGRIMAANPKGLDTPIVANGLMLPPGVRRRLGLARALAADGRLVVFDEPTEGLDAEGVQHVYALLIELAREGRTIIVATHDQNIVKGAQLVLDLDVNPVPRLVRRQEPMAVVQGGLSV